METTQRSLREWIDLVVRRKTTATATGSLVFGIILLATLVWPPAYRSSAKILVQNNRAQYLVSPAIGENSPQDRPVVVNPVSQEDLNSELELLTSLFLVRQALENLSVPHSSSPVGAIATTLIGALQLPVRSYDLLHQTPSLTPRDQWVFVVARHLSASVIKQSNIIEVSFDSHDPKWCQEFLTRLLNDYFAYHSRISHDPEAEKFFKDQAAMLKTRLETSENTLRKFQIETGITDLAAQKQALVNRISDVQLQYQHTVADLAAAEQQTATLNENLKRTPQRIGKEIRSVQNLALQQLKPQVAQLEAQRAELLTRYQPSSARIAEIDARLAAAQRILSHEQNLEVHESSTDLNPVWVTVDTNLAAARTQSASLKAQRDALATQVDKLGGQLTMMVNNGVQIERLKRQVDTDKDAYLAFVRKTEEARTAQALNLNKILNISIAQAPMLPLQPVYPNVWLNLFLGILLAAGLALGAAWWEEERDPRIFSSAAIAHASGLDTVAVLSDENP